MRKFRAAPAVVGVILLITPTTAGCSTNGPVDPPSGPYAAEISEARRYLKTDLEQQILSDNKITDSEFEQLFDKFSMCAKDHGVTITMERRKGVYAGYSVSPTNESVENECRIGSIGVLEPLYNAMRKRPSGEDWADQMADCLKRKGVIGPQVTGEDFRRAQQAVPPQRLPGEDHEEEFGDCAVGA